MSKNRTIILPKSRPTINIQPLADEPFTVNFREGPWYFTVLETGEKSQWAIYDPPDWRRTYVYNMEVIGKAVVHEEECLEVRGDENENGVWKENAFRHYAQITDKTIKYLATISYRDGVPHLDTFLDDHFHEDWGRKVARIWQDEGRFLVEGNHFITKDANKSGGAGLFAVTIGKKVYPCLRVLETTWASGEDGILVEAYLSSEGRTVLFRRYNGKNWRPGSDWLKQAEANQRLFLDGAEFVHWYDCVSSFTLE